MSSSDGFDCPCLSGSTSREIYVHLLSQGQIIIYVVAMSSGVAHCLAQPTYKPYSWSSLKDSIHLLFLSKYALHMSRARVQGPLPLISCLCLCLSE